MLQNKQTAKRPGLRGGTMNRRAMRGKKRKKTFDEVEVKGKNKAEETKDAVEGC